MDGWMDGWMFDVVYTLCAGVYVTLLLLLLLLLLQSLLPTAADRRSAKCQFNQIYNKWICSEVRNDLNVVYLTTLNSSNWIESIKRMTIIRFIMRLLLLLHSFLLVLIAQSSTRRDDDDDERQFEGWRLCWCSFSWPLFDALIDFLSSALAES